MLCKRRYQRNPVTGYFGDWTISRGAEFENKIFCGRLWKTGLLAIG
jgi:hypothetical protein